MSLSANRSKSSSTNLGTDVWGPQQPFLQDMYARASQMLGQSQGIGNEAMGAAGQQWGNMANMAGQLGNFAQQQAQGVDPMMGAYANAIGQNFREQIMPGLNSQAMQVGGLGGSRAGIGGALAASRANQQMQDFGAQLYGGQQDRAMQAMMGAGGMYGSAAMGQQDFAKGQMQQFWSPLANYAAIIGSPVMRNLGGSSSGSSWGAGIGWPSPQG